MNVADVAEHVRDIRRHTRLPVGVGFGVKDAGTATELARVADAVVVGSALVAAIESAAADEAGMHAAARELIGSLRAGMDTVSRAA